MYDNRQIFILIGAQNYKIYKMEEEFLKQKRIKTGMEQMDEGEILEDEENTRIDFNTWKDDLTFAVEGKQIHVCKQVLGLVSPVFDAMFGGDFKEKDPEDIELPGKKHADFCEFLRCVYPNMLHRVTISNVHEVLPLADEYQIMRLKTECETCLLESLSKDTPAEELYNLLLSAYLHNLESLKGKAVDLLAEKSQEDLDEAAETVILPPDAELDIHKKMVRILKARTCKMVEKSKTLAVLYGCLAATAKDNQIMLEYTKGKWIGDSARFEVDIKGDNLQEVIGMQVRNSKFTVILTKDYNYLKLSLKGASDDVSDVRVMGMIIVNNWMKGKVHKANFFSGHVRSSSSGIDKIIEKGELENESSGYIYCGKIKGDIHILVLDEK